MANYFKAFMVLTVAIGMIAGAGASGWINQDNQVVHVTSSHWDAIDIDVNIDGMQTREVTTKGGIFMQLNVVGDAWKGEVGSPRLPVIRKMVEIPYGAEVNLNYTIDELQTLDLGSVQVIPVQPPIPKIQGAMENAMFRIDSELYGRDEFISQPDVRIQDIDFMRGHRIVVLEISPVAYNPGENLLQFAGSISIRLELSNSDRELTQRMDYRYYSTPFEVFFQDNVLNYGAYRSRDYTFPPVTPIGYLILNVADYSTAIAPFVEWKTMQGYDVTIEVVPAGATTTSVKAIIQNAYNTWPNPPAYVLLNGDTNTLPAYTGENSGSADDNQYTELEGTGYYTPDIMIGRFPIRSVTDLENILAKDLQWDQTTMPDTGYMKDSVFLASSDHASMLEATHEWCFNNHILPYDPANIYHSVYERLGGGTSDFASNVNAGRGFVCYSGHGYGDGTGTASVHFVHSNVSALTNVDKYGHVMVFACGTNLHDQTISFGERWLLEANKGSVSYWGTSDSSYWDEDDYQQREIFRIQHEDHYYTLSSMYLAGLIEVYMQGGASAYYFDIYNLMGDPSTIFHGRIPMDPVIDALQNTTPNPQTFNVNVSDDSGPVKYALVAINMNGDLLGSAFTDAAGDAAIYIEPTEPGTASIVVTGRNLMKTEQSLMVMAAGCGFVTLDSALTNCDDLLGITLWDADLNVNPGVADTASVQIYSDSEPSPETVVLTESGPNTSEFVGTIMTSDSNSGLGYLLVSDGDIVTVHYHDANCEGSPADVYDYADVDCVGPVISNVTIEEISTNFFTVTWMTDEPTDTVLVWGDTTPPANTESIAELVTYHAVTIEGLDDCTMYYFMVSGTDVGGNTATDDNYGSYYTAITYELVVFLDANMNTNPGWTYQGQWAWGVPAGSSGDPSSGHTGSNVVGYNLNGSYSNNMSATYCTTQNMDCSDAGEVFLSYYHWLGIESSTWDHASVQVSGNGGSSWTTIWDHTGDSVAPSSWSYAEFDISSVAAGSSNVQIRWVMGTTDSSVVYCGWNLDDVLVSYTAECTSVATPTPVPTATPNLCLNTGDVNDDGSLTAGDAQMAFQIALGAMIPTEEEECAADCNGDGDCTAGDAQSIFLGALGMGSCTDPIIGRSESHTATLSRKMELISPDSDLLWVENSAVAVGETVSISIWLDNPKTAIDAFTLNVRYPVELLELVEVTEGTLNPEWLDFGWNDSSEGIATIAAYNSGLDDYEIQAAGNGSLVVLTFRAFADLSTTDVSIIRAQDDLQGFVIH
ncbi:hypothetical protein JW823_09410 [bacterium]|nr:hypothetical protein [candidate division CSSED10-310 bacterium]